MKTFLFIYLLFVVAIFLGTIKDFDSMAITPRQIYECNNMNMFGCVVLFMASLMINPLFYIAHFLYWIFHVGRKDWTRRD